MITQPADAALLPRGVPGVGQRPHVGAGGQAQPDQHDGGQHPQPPVARAAALAGSAGWERAAPRRVQDGVCHGAASAGGTVVCLFCHPGQGLLKRR